MTGRQSSRFLPAVPAWKSCAVTLLEAGALFAAAVAAGLMNAVAGGGTLITFPVLLLFGTNALVANATSTVALVVGTAGSMFGFRRELVAMRYLFFRFVPVSIAGGWIGSVLLTRTDERVFETMVPFLILFATVLFVAQGIVRSFAARHQAGDVEAAMPGWTWKVWAAMAFHFGVSIYGGYFGAGIGILMLASLGAIGLTNIHAMNAVKNALGSLINCVAAIWFIISGLVDWSKASVMIVGALAGYFVGAHYSRAIPQHRMRQLIGAIGFTICAVMFWEQFLKK
jgi:uncharacterized membrane protein YfcA